MMRSEREKENRGRLKTYMRESDSLTLRVGDPTLIPPRLQGCAVDILCMGMGKTLWWDQALGYILDPAMCWRGKKK